MSDPSGSSLLIRPQLMVPFSNEHFMHIKYVFPRGTRNVPLVTFLNVEKLNRIGFISLRVSSIILDLKYRLCSITAKPHSNSAEICFLHNCIGRKVKITI